MSKKKSRRKRKITVSVLLDILGTGVLIVLIAVCLPLTVPRMLGYNIYTVVSGSMEPAIPVGSLVYINNMDPKDVQEEDVIAFYSAMDEGSIITHRVVVNSTVMKEFVTKGDTNEEQDMNPIPYENFIGKVVLTVPKAGGLAQAFVSTSGKIAAASLIALAVVLYFLAAILKKDE